MIPRLQSCFQYCFDQIWGDGRWTTYKGGKYPIYERSSCLDCAHVLCLKRDQAGQRWSWVLRPDHALLELQWRWWWWWWWWWWWYIYYDEVSVCLSVTKNHHFFWEKFFLNFFFLKIFFLKFFFLSFFLWFFFLQIFKKNFFFNFFLIFFWIFILFFFQLHMLLEFN